MSRSSAEDWTSTEDRDERPNEDQSIIKEVIAAGYTQAVLNAETDPERGSIPARQRFLDQLHGLSRLERSSADWDPEPEVPERRDWRDTLKDLAQGRLDSPDFNLRFADRFYPDPETERFFDRMRWLNNPASSPAIEDHAAKLVAEFNAASEPAQPGDTNWNKRNQFSQDAAAAILGGASALLKEALLPSLVENSHEIWEPQIRALAENRRPNGLTHQDLEAHIARWCQNDADLKMHGIANVLNQTERQITRSLLYEQDKPETATAVSNRLHNLSVYLETIPEQDLTEPPVLANLSNKVTDDQSYGVQLAAGVNLATEQYAEGIYNAIDQLNGIDPQAAARYYALTLQAAGIASQTILNTINGWATEGGRPIEEEHILSLQDRNWEPLATLQETVNRLLPPAAAHSGSPDTDLPF